MLLNFIIGLFIEIRLWKFVNQDIFVYSGKDFENYYYYKFKKGFMKLKQ